LQLAPYSPQSEWSIGWGTTFSLTIPANQVIPVRLAYKIQGPVTSNTIVRLHCWEHIDTENTEDHKPWSLKRDYKARDLPMRSAPADLPTAKLSEDKRHEILKAFASIQKNLKSQRYDLVWDAFSLDYRQAEFHDRYESFFLKAMASKLEAAFVWSPKVFVTLQPETVFCTKSGYGVKAKGSQSQAWLCEFVMTKDGWKLDWIAGYRPQVLTWKNWPNHVLPRAVKRSGLHVDLYYFPGTIPDGKVETILRERDQAVVDLSRWLGCPARRLSLVLFQDEDTKFWETGHRGAGVAVGDTIAEVYNDETQLDAYHETAHCLTMGWGKPPIALVEGLAVYLSEVFNKPALNSLGGGNLHIVDRVRDIRRMKAFISLDKLLAMESLGVPQNVPPVAYAEAGSLVKFLVERFGKMKFLKAYRSVKADAVPGKAAKSLASFYGLSVQELEAAWLAKTTD